MSTITITRVRLLEGEGNDIDTGGDVMAAMFGIGERRFGAFEANNPGHFAATVPAGTEGDLLSHEECERVAGDPPDAFDWSESEWRLMAYTDDDGEQLYVPVVSHHVEVIAQGDVTFNLTPESRERAGLDY